MYLEWILVLHVITELRRRRDYDYSVRAPCGWGQFAGRRVLRVRRTFNTPTNSTRSSVQAIDYADFFVLSPYIVVAHEEMRLVLAWEGSRPCEVAADYPTHLLYYRFFKVWQAQPHRQETPSNGTTMTELDVDTTVADTVAPGSQGTRVKGWRRTRPIGFNACI